MLILGGINLSKKIFGTAFADGLLFAVALKTGVDASEGGIAVAFLEALRGIAPSSFPLDAIIWGITIAGAIVLILFIRDHPLEAGGGFVIGFLLGMI